MATEEKKGGQGEERGTVRKRRRQQASNSSTDVNNRLVSLGGRSHKPTCPLRNLEKLSVPAGSLLVQERIKNPKNPQNKQTPSKQINKIAQVCCESPHFAHFSQDCCPQRVLLLRGKKRQTVSSLLSGRRILLKTVDTCQVYRDLLQSC